MKAGTISNRTVKEKLRNVDDLIEEMERNQVEMEQLLGEIEDKLSKMLGKAE